jgi:hypothetical protein
MTDQIIVLTALKRAAAIVANYLQSGCPRDELATTKQLIEVLDSPEFAAAIKRVEEGYGFYVVK